MNAPDINKSTAEVNPDVASQPAQEWVDADIPGEVVAPPPTVRTTKPAPEPAPEPEKPLPLPGDADEVIKPANAAGGERRLRVPQLDASSYRMVELPEEDVPIAPSTDCPTPNPNVHVTNNHNCTPPWQMAATPESVDAFSKSVILLPEQSSEVNERIMAVARPSNMGTPLGSLWTAALQYAHATSAQAGMVQSPAQFRENSKWEQFLRTPTSSFGFTTPKYGEADAPLVDGLRARIRVRALMGNGGVITVPLVRSGFWITLHAPTESAYYDLMRRFNDDKIKYGRETSGMIFSNEQVYMNDWLLEFCLDHVYDATVKYERSEDLRPLIDCLDLPALFAGMARLMYSRGFDYVRAVATTEGIKKTELIQGRLDIAKLLWIDNSYFTDKQRNHMANRARSVSTVESLAAYREEMRHSAGRELKLSPSISLLLHVPNAERYCDDGDRWISAVTTMVDESFTVSRPSVEERNKIISRHASMATMMRYRSFIKAVRFDNLEHTHDEAVESTLKTLSEDQAFVETFEKEIKSFIADNTASMIAIPTTVGLESENENQRFPNLIPLDVVTVFFILLAQKMSK